MQTNKIIKILHLATFPIIQVFLCTKEVPTDWKTAFVTPFSKREYYHPINITSVVAKILERVVNDSVMKHLKLNGILLPSQNGFKAEKSVETIFLKTYDVI